MAKLTKEEKNRMNDIIRPRFGAKHQITGGSKDENGAYHLVIGDPIGFVSDTDKQNIGKKLKENYDDAVYFSGGVRIA